MVHTPPDPNDYAKRNFDEAWFRVLRRELSALPEADRLQFLTAVLELQHESDDSMTLWLKLAERVLEKRDSFAQLVRIGLAYGDASTIRPWLEVGARRLGGRRLVALLRKEHNVRPRQVALTCYWLPSLARSPAEKHEIQQFIDAVQQDAPERTER